MFIVIFLAALSCETLTIRAQQGQTTGWRI